MAENDALTQAMEPSVQQMVTADGAEETALAGAGILRIETHALDFSETQNPPNPNWVARTKIITPPTGWTNATVSVSMWSFDMFPRERPITYLGARAGIQLIGGMLQISAYAICRDSNSDDPWRARISIQVIFLG